MLAFGEDVRVGSDISRHAWGVLTSLPVADRDFATMTSDGHDLPPVLARHDTFVNDVDAADRYGVWKLSDALLACTFEGTSCDVALGNTPGQRFLSVWSFGLPIAELWVTNDATQPPAS